MRKRRTESRGFPAIILNRNYLTDFIDEIKYNTVKNIPLSFSMGFQGVPLVDSKCHFGKEPVK